MNNKRSVFIISLLFLFFIVIFCFGFGGKNKESNWEIILSVKRGNIPVQAFIVGFLNENFGVAADTDFIYLTNDKGSTWTKKGTKSRCLRDMNIINENNYVLISECAGFNATSNSGENWDKLAYNNGKIMSFQNINNGWYGNINEILFFNNGKIANLTLPESNKFGLISALSFISNDDGYAIDEKGNLAYTNNNGNSWVIKNMNIDKYEFSLLPNFVRMKFLDEKNGIIIAYSRSKKEKDRGWYSLTTNDGGVNWKIEKIKEINDFGIPYLSVDGKTLTILPSSPSKDLIVIKRK